MIQNLSHKLFTVTDENGGKLKNRVVLFCDEPGAMPPFEILPLFSAGRSHRLTLVPIIQSRTVLSGSVARNKGSNSQSLQTAERPFMSLDELRSIPKGQFIVMKTGSHPTKTQLRLFLTGASPSRTPILCRSGLTAEYAMPSAKSWNGASSGPDQSLALSC